MLSDAGSIPAASTKFRMQTRLSDENPPEDGFRFSRVIKGF